ncbi:MAG TPA: hypothetical protein VF212_11435 [Longimicrobiales bacterium]
MLTREQILGMDDLPREEVFVPEWKGSVFVRALTGSERDQLERMIAKDSVSRASIVALCVVDERGERLFSQKDVDALSKKHGQALERIVTAALHFNALTDEAIEAGKGD